MSSQRMNRDMYPSVKDFYKGKSVLITGAAGFVGMVMMEILLRNVPEIKSIYILIRKKKGLSAEERMEKLLQKPLYHQLKKEQPDFTQKIHLVSGDVDLPNLGMSDEDTQEVIENVSIVFHCAAVINFLKPLKDILLTNVIGTHRVVQLCKKLKSIEALIYTSTICSNFNRHIKVEERIYRLPFPAQTFLNEIQNGSNESVEELVSQCHPHWPNTYTFSKCLSENVLQECGSEIPVAIIRPSICASVWKAPYEGFCERNSAIALLLLGVGKGFLRVVFYDPEVNVDVVPVDVVANTHIVAAWKVATGRSPSPFIVNCTSIDFIRFTWDELTIVCMEMNKRHPLPNSFRTMTGVKHVKSRTMFSIMTFYEHYVPAYFIDFLLKLAGKKPKLVGLYRLFDKASISTSFFTLYNWSYTTDNFLKLEEDRDAECVKTFYTNMSDLTPQKLADDIPKGNREIFDWSLDKRTLAERQKKIGQRQALSKAVQYCFLAIVCMVLYFTCSQVSWLIGIL